MTITMTDAFERAIRNIDYNLQGRIFSAVLTIWHAPTSPRGDTVKPLRYHKGLWRYRIGGYRLIYRPNLATGTVELIDFAARGSIYD